MAMTCFSLLNPRIGRRLMPQTELHLCAHFTITPAQIPTADRSFGANGSSPAHNDKKRCDDASHSNSESFRESSTACEIHLDAYLLFVRPRPDFGSAHASSRRF